VSDFVDVQKESANSCLLSIIVPAYNVEKYVRQCIDSVLNIVPNDGAVEIIVVNDGSTDTTREILAEYNSEKRVRIFNNDNFGVSAARNFAIEQVNGKYIGFLDADDYWQNVSWNNLFNFLQSDCHIIEFNAIRVNEQGEFDMC
jgi:glycosyltransferase involved in cell wall biosynthesis